MSPWQPIKFSNLDKSHMKHRGLLNTLSTKRKFKYICNETAKKKCKFPLFHCKSMGTISCHSNQNYYSTGIKKHNVEAYVLSMYMYVKFQLRPLYGCREEDFLIFFSNKSNYIIYVNDLNESHMKHGGLLNKHTGFSLSLKNRRFCL